jgi:hypothetical protein
LEKNNLFSINPLFSVMQGRRAGSKPAHVLSPCKIPKSTKKFVIDEVIFQVELGGYIKSRALKGGFRTRPYGPNII